MQRGYRYTRIEPVGKNFHPDFTPELTPEEMLRLGVFGGHYFSDRPKEFPSSWWRNAKLSRVGYDADKNFFKVKASQPLSVWRKKGWIDPRDPRGWFQWYCRYYLGRRIPKEDERQIKRWQMIRRHIVQLQKHCTRGDRECRPVQRQALLHWAYDSRRY